MPNTLIDFRGEHGTLYAVYEYELDREGKVTLTRVGNAHQCIMKERPDRCQQARMSRRKHAKSRLQQRRHPLAPLPAVDISEWVIQTTGRSRIRSSRNTYGIL